MATTTDTRLEIASWQEEPYREMEDGSKLTRADVVLTGGTDVITDATFEALMYYRPDGTSSYVTLMRVTGTFDGRSGSFVSSGEGSYDGTTARVHAALIEGSASADLAGLTATIDSTSTHADYPFMPLTVNFSFA